MNFGSKTALGIDITDDRISMVLLKHGKDGLSLVKSAGAAVADGAVKNGNIEDASALSKSMKELKRHMRARASRAAVSLFVRPAIMQVIPVPKQAPTNIREFVRREVKHCVALPTANIAFDFCGLGLARRGPSNRKVLAVATDNEKLAELVGVCGGAGLHVELVEPALLSYIRAFHAKKTAGKANSSVLMAILRPPTLTLCVLLNGTLDFVRTKDINKDRGEAGDWPRWLGEEINEIIRFYDIDVPDRRGEWEITVVTDSVHLGEDAEESLRKLVTCSSLQVRSADDAYLDTPVGEFLCEGDEAPSPVAIGLAMGLLRKNDDSSAINLLPPEIVEIRSLKTHALIAANIIAAVWLIMFLAGGELSLMTNKVRSRISQVQSTQLARNMRTLLREQVLIDRQIAQLAVRPDRMKEICDSHIDVHWGRVLKDIRLGIPKAARITNLSSRARGRIALRGEAISYEAVHLFVNNLDKSKDIDSASLTETEKDEDDEQLVRYEIDCVLIAKEREQNSAD